jgi:hypothetical protein
MDTATLGVNLEVLAEIIDDLTELAYKFENLSDGVADATEDWDEVLTGFIVTKELRKFIARVEGHWQTNGRDGYLHRIAEWR